MKGKFMRASILILIPAVCSLSCPILKAKLGKVLTKATLDNILS